MDGVEIHAIAFGGMPISIAAFLIIRTASIVQFVACGCGETMMAFLVFRAIITL